jgi:hypothetical protein
MFSPSLRTTLPASALFFLLALWLAVPATAQVSGPDTEETLGNSVRSSGGYGAPTVAVTSVNGEAAIVAGGQGGWILNRQFVIGGAGRGLVTLPDTDFRGQSAQIQLGYGGLLLEYIGAPAQLVHYGAGVVLGGGIAQIVDLPFDPQFDGDLDQSAVFVAEPGGRLELNVTTYFRLGLAGGYRLVQGSDLRGVSNTDLSGPFGRLSFRFGQF